MFSYSCRSIIKENFISAFKKLVFNYHPSALPQGRGGAPISWQIMNEQKFVASTIHQMDKGIDSGPILFQSKKELKLKRPTLLDYDVLISKSCADIFEIFLKKIKSNQKIKLRKQNENNSSYLPRLHTEVNEAINFDWTNEEIEKFVRAFSFPYPGAFTFVRKHKIAILDCFIEKSKIKFHPFTNGRVNKKFSDGTVRIVTKNGFLRISKIRVNNKVMNPSEFLRINDVLFTPHSILDKSRMEIASVKNMK